MQGAEYFSHCPVLLDEAVRALAQKSAVAAKEISQMIGESVNRVGEGQKLALSNGEIFKAMTSSIENLNRISAEVKDASEGQTTALTQMSEAMNQIDSNIQKNASSAENGLNLAQNIIEISGSFSKIVQDLQVLVDGSTRAQKERTRVVVSDKVKSQAA